MFCIITNQTEANVWLTSVALDQPLRRLILVTCARSQWRVQKFLIEHVINIKALNGSDLLNNDMDFMLSQVAECSTFNPTCDAQMRTGIHLLDAVWLKYDNFFYCKTDHFRCVRELGIICFYRPTVCVHWTETNLSCLNKTKLFSKVKECFMCFYVFCMNKHVVVGITLSVFLLVL